MSSVDVKEISSEDLLKKWGETETSKNSATLEQKKFNVPNALTLYVVFSILVILIYTIVEMAISTQYQVSHDTLTTCFYSVFGGEILCCALIKIFKLRRRDDEMGE